MKISNKIIKTIVYNGKYKGLKKSEIANNEIIMNQFDVDLLHKLSDYNDLSNAGIYFLISVDETNTKIYVGQSQNLYLRLKKHFYDEKKVFNRILTFYSKYNNLSKTFFDFLEYHYINKINQQNYYILENKDKRAGRPILNEIENIEVYEYIESIDHLLDFVDINLNPNDILNEKEIDIFFLKEAKLIFKRGDYFLLSGSKIPKKIKLFNYTKNSTEKIGEKRKNNLENFIEINKEFLEENEMFYELKNDIKINSSSMAACIVKGSPAANGWTDWKNKNNQTLNDVYRKGLNT